MKKSLSRRPSPSMVVAIAALVVAICGAAIAAIPDSNGLIHGCYGKKNGKLRLSDPESSDPKVLKPCNPKQEIAIDWHPDVSHQVAGGDLAGSYPNPLIKTGAVNSLRVLDNSLSANDLAPGSVNVSELADEAVLPAAVAPLAGDSLSKSAVPILFRITVSTDTTLTVHNMSIVDAWSANTGTNVAGDSWRLKDHLSGPLTDAVDVSGGNQEVHRAGAIDSSLTGTTLKVDLVGTPQIEIYVLGVPL